MADKKMAIQTLDNPPADITIADSDYHRRCAIIDMLYFYAEEMRVRYIVVEHVTDMKPGCLNDIHHHFCMSARTV